MSFRPLLLPAMLLWLLAGPWPGADSCLADDKPPAAAQGTDVLRFRRVYVPVDRIKDWPRQSAKYLPIAADEFERLLAIAADAASEPQGVGIPQPATAEYRAQLVGNQLTAGKAVLQVNHAAKTPAWMPLDPCGLAIGKAAWADAEPAKTTLGLAADGILALLVERSGRLEFDWSLAGRRDATDAVTFQVELPACPVNRLLLDAPADFAISADPGMVQESGFSDEGVRQWLIELGGHNRFRLRAVPADAPQQRPQLALVRESVSYDVSLHGLEASVQLKFEVHNEPLTQVTLVLDPELQLVSARYGSTPVAWSVVGGGTGKETRVVLTLPEAIQDTGRTLRLGAIAPLAGDQPFRLPRIRPEGVFWQEGSATLAVAAPLEIKHLVPTGCRQSGTGPLPAPRVGESAQFQYFTPDAAIEVALGTREASLELQSGTSVELGRRELKARVVAEFRAAEAPAFTLEADVSPHWLIDSAESVPPNAIDDWTVERQREGKAKLTLRLAQALTPEQPLRIVLSARRPGSPLWRRLDIDDLVPVRFRAAESRRLVALRAADPYQLALTGTEQIKRLDPGSLDPSELKLFDEPPRSWLFENGAGASRLRVVMRSREPSYAAAIEAEAIVDNEILRENYVLRCAPESAWVGSVLVRFSQRRATPPRWTLGGDDKQQLTARLLPGDEPIVAGAAADQETWEISLPRPRNTPFEIRASRETKLVEWRPLSLASLLDAGSQRGTLIIRCLGSQTLQIKNSRLAPLPVETAASNQYQTTRAAYRYDPVRDTMPASGAGVTVRSCDDAVASPAWVWHCHLQSRYQADGTARHVASYRLQNSGSPRMVLTLPSHATLQDVRDVCVDGSRVVWHRGQKGKENTLAIDLPAEEKFPVVTVEFTTAAGAWRTIGSLEPPLPQADLPVLFRYWTVWLPPGYGRSGSDGRWRPLGPAPSSWTQRLLGPLGRAAGDGLFNPLAAASWSGGGADRSARRAATLKAEQLLHVLGTAPAAETASQRTVTVDWAGVLRQRLDAAQVNLLVDRYAMVQLGLTPRTPVRLSSGDTAVSRAIDLLQKADLALIAEADLVVLTSRSEAAVLHDWLAPLGYQGVFQVRGGPLVEQIRQAAAGGDANIVPLKTWQESAAESRGVWHPTSLAVHEPTDTPGWTAYRAEISDAAPASLEFVHEMSFRLFDGAAFLLVVALGWWQIRRGNTPLVILLGVFAAAALLLVEPFASVARAAVLGVLFCLAARWACRRYQMPSGIEVSRGHDDRNHGSNNQGGNNTGSGNDNRSGVAAARAVVLPLVAAAALCAATRASAQEPAKPSAPAPSPIHRVLVPVDDRQQPAGGKYYLPDDFYKQLYRRAAAAAEKPEHWLIGAATYRGTLSRENSSDRLVVGELRASYDLYVFSRMARIRVPLQREGASLLAEGVSLDGRTIQPDWEPDGDALVFDVAEPGQYRLEVMLRPTLHSTAAQAGFDLAIPRVATSRLELSLSGDAPAVEVPSAIGTVAREDDPARLVAQLGPADRLSVRWPTGSGSSAAASAVDTEQLLWLKVQPGSVVLEMRLKIKVVEGQVRQLQLSADPGLRLLPLKGEDAPTAEVRGNAGQTQTINLQWPRPISDRVIVDATFLLTGASGVGNLRPPELDVIDARTTRRWLAVSVDPVLEYDVRSSADAESLAVPDFVAAWGKVDSAPLFAVRLRSAETAWSMANRPRQPLNKVEQTLALGVMEDHTTVLFDAHLATTAGYNFQLRVKAPTDLEVEHVSLLEEGIDRAARWSQDRDGTVTVFLTGPVAGPQAFSLRGRLPTLLRKRVALPLVQIEQCEVLSSTLQLFRQPTVQVAVSDAAGLIELENLLLEPGKPELGRLVGLFRVASDQRAKATLTVTPNQPRVRAEQVMSLARDGKSWKAQIDCRLRVTGGAIDELHLDAAAPFAGPYKVTPAETVKILDATGENRQLVVRPRNPISGEYRFSISSPLPSSGEQVAVPEVAIKQMSQCKRFLVLPQVAMGHSAAWQTNGLEPSTLPAGFAASADGGPVAVYEVVGEHYSAILGSAGPARQSAQVRLADVCVAWQDDGTCRGVATFDLEPSTLPECPLWLPQGYRLVQVAVDGVPASLVPAGANAWQVLLGPARLPQRVEVIFTGALQEADGSGRRRFDVPSLGDLPVAASLWTVAGPSGLEMSSLDAGEPITPWQCAMVRLKNIVGLMQTTAAIGGSAREVPDWYRPWARRFIAARSAVQGESKQMEQDPLAAAGTKELLAIDGELSRLAAQLGANNILAQLSAQPPVDDEPDDLWRWSLERRQAVVRYAFSGSAKSITLTLTCRPAERDSSTDRLLPALGAVAVILLGGFAMRRNMFGALPTKWPHATGVALGLAWWLWLWPSWLGLAIVLACVLSASHPFWRRLPGLSSIIVSRSAPR